MIILDGSHGEGGGQIVRTALALSTVTGRAFRVTDIRKNRPQPGLKAQHLTAITALKEICGAKAPLVGLGITELEYAPGAVTGGNYSFDIGTAGSISLLLQALLLPLLFAPKPVKLTLTGGTCGLWQAPVEYFQHVLLPHLQKFAEITCAIERRGYYPKGNGRVVVRVKPRVHDLTLLKIVPFDLSVQGKLVSIHGVSHASADLEKREVAERQARAAKLLLRKYDVPVTIDTHYSESLSTGSGITLWARFQNGDEFHTVLGADAIGERDVSADAVGTIVAENLKKEIDSGAAVDSYLADQLLPFLAFCGGVVKTSTVTEHARTNMMVIEKFLDVKFVVEDNLITANKNKSL